MVRRPERPSRTITLRITHTPFETISLREIPQGDTLLLKSCHKPFSRQLQQIPVILLPRPVRILGADERAGQNPADIRIDTRCGDIEGKVQDCRGCVGTQTLDRNELCEVFRKNSIVLFDDCSDCVAQPECAAVIAHPPPCQNHLLIGSARQIAEAGKLPEKIDENDPHPIHLRLLEHDLGNQDLIRSFRIIRNGKIAPGKLSFMASIPVPNGVHKGFDAVRLSHAQSIMECGLSCEVVPSYALILILRPISATNPLTPPCVLPRLFGLRSYSAS